MDSEQQEPTTKPILYRQSLANTVSLQCQHCRVRTMVTSVWRTTFTSCFVEELEEVATCSRQIELSTEKTLPTNQAHVDMAAVRET
jgi:hypothetical protein